MVLAALRLFQSGFGRRTDDGMVYAEFLGAECVSPLGVDEIDSFCEDINIVADEFTMNLDQVAAVRGAVFLLRQDVFDLKWICDGIRDIATDGGQHGPLQFLLLDELYKSLSKY